MRLTRRGAAAVGIAVLGVGAGVFSSTPARPVAALTVPMIVLLLVGAWQLSHRKPLTVTRTFEGALFAGQTQRLGIEVEGRGVVTVAHRFWEGTSATTAQWRSLPARVSFEVRPPSRGEVDIGTTTVGIRDDFGLLAADRVVDREETAVVYPPVYEVELPESTGDGLDQVGRTSDIDHVRPYEDGDPIRAIDWKRSAKRNELVVRDGPSGEDQQTVTVVVGAAEGYGDEMAAAAASVVVAAFAAGSPVVLQTPTERVLPSSAAGLTPFLRALALAEAGDVPETRADAPITVFADETGTAIRTADSAISLRDRLTTTPRQLVARG
jgi:uncharacterized protein (DUF58 family)